MNYHLLTQPHSEWLELTQNNLCLLHWSQLLSGATEGLVVQLPKSNRPTIEKKIEQLEKLHTLRNRLLPEFAHRLRTIHGIDFPDTYWEILLLPWFTSSLSNYLCRIDVVQQTLKNETVLSISLLESDDAVQIAADTKDFFHSLHDQFWQSRRDKKILEFLNFSGEYFFKSHPKIDSNFMGMSEKSIARKVKEKVQSASMNFTRFNTGYLENTYLPPLTEARVQFMLGQFPVSNRSIDWRLYINNYNDVISPNRMQRFPIRDRGNPLNNFEEFLMDELWPQIPRIFLEHFGEMRALSLEAMPKKATYVFTSNSFHIDEVFKFWIAELKTAGTKYIIGQHGNNYGANLLTSQTPEQTTSDYFLTWGWRSSNPKFLPTTCFNIAGRPHTSSKDGGLLLLSQQAPGEHQAWDETREYYDQLTQQHDFVDLLELNIESSTTVRISPLNTRIGDNFPNSWTNSIGKCSLDLGNISYRKIRSGYRLAVFSYDSTGLLEGLASNIPTMGFWLDGLDHLNAFARSKYQYLIDAEIVFLDSKKCASKVNSIWNDVSGWWNSSEVQSARSNFCEDFCESKQNPASVIASAIREALDSTNPHY